MLNFSASCRLEFDGPVHTNSTLSNRSDVLEQPASVNTAQKCYEACQGPKRDGILLSGHGCITAEFKDGRCRIGTSYPYKTYGPDYVVMYSLKWKCTSGLYPGKYLLHLNLSFLPLCILSIHTEGLPKKNGDVRFPKIIA